MSQGEEEQQREPVVDLRAAGKKEPVSTCIPCREDLTVKHILIDRFQPNFLCNNAESSRNVTDWLSIRKDDDTCHTYNITSNSSIQCNHGYIYDVPRESSIVSEWDLVCSKAYLAEVSQTVFIIGMTIGSALIPIISDKIGRKWSFIGCRLVLVAAAFSTAVIPNITGFMVCRFVSGVLTMAIGVTQFVYIMEYTSNRYRSLANSVIALSWAGSLLILALIGHLMRDQNWRVLFAVCSVPTLTVFLDIFFLKESLLWLYANSKTKEASDILREAMKVNEVTGQDLISLNKDQEQKPGKEIQPAIDEAYWGQDPTSKLQDNEKESEVETKVEKYNLIDVLKNSTTRKILLILCCTWFVNSLVYYGIFLMSSAMAGDRILNFFCNALAEIPGYLALHPILKYLGRKKPMVGLHGFCAVSLLLAGVFNFTLTGQTKVVMMQIVTFAGKMGISTTFMMIYIYTTEVFPTNYRASGLGIASASARVGSIISPFSSVFIREYPWGPGVVFGGLCLIVTVLLLFVPETTDRNLPQTMAEIERWKKSPKDTDSNKTVRA